MNTADRISSLTSSGGARWWLLLITVALLTRLAWAAAMAPRQPYSDEIHYIAQARSLAEGRGYVDESGRPTAYWPVGYPALLSVGYRLGGSSGIVDTVLQIALSIATVVIVAWIGTAAFGAHIGRSAALLLSVYPNHVFYSTLYLSEPLFCFLVTASVGLLLRGAQINGARKQVLFLAAAGISLGLAALARSVIVLFPAVLPIWFLRQSWPISKLLTRTALITLCATLAVGPWMWRNHAVTKKWFTISSNGGDAFWVGNYPGALGGYAGWLDMGTRWRPEDARSNNLGDGLRMGTGDLETREYGMGLRAIDDHPAQAFLRVFQKVSYFFALETDGALWNIKGFGQPPLALAPFPLALASAAYLVVVSFAILGIICTPGKHALVSLFLLLTGYLVLATVAFFGDPRYHYVLLPIASIFAVKGMLEGIPWLSKRFEGNERDRRRHLATWGSVVGIYLVLIAVNLVLKFLEFKRYVSS
jgi:4-amino-4-deoxy-L-arabinose transferase-like glycosyltransferase